MAALVGKDFPEEVAFMHVPYVAEKAGVHEVCGMPVKYDASKGRPLISRDFPFFNVSTGKGALC